jgi:exonuclease SbcD
LLEGAYCPFSPEETRAAGFAYCFAGHIHSASSSDALVYPGSPEPLGWGELGRHCVALASIESTGVEVELVEVNSHRYEERKVSCQDCEHGAEVAERLESALSDSDAGVVHLRAVLEGEVDRECLIDPEELAAPYRERYAEFAVIDETYPRYDLEALAAQPTAAGHFVRRLQERIEDETDQDQRHILELALASGLRALDGHEDIVRVD